MENLVFFPKNTEDNKVTLPASVNKLVAETYAPERQKNASFYATRRGGFPPTLFDCWYYKCAEFAAAKFLNEKHGLPLTKPDTRIYKSSQKTWNADLSFTKVAFLGKNFDELRFHNKSVTRKVIEKGYPESFVFQLSNKSIAGGRDHIFDKGDDSDYCIFVYVPYDRITTGRIDFYIRGIMPWSFIKENNLLEDPRKKQLQGVKLCVYTESIRKFLSPVTP